MRPRRRSHNYAFTLVELLVTLTISMVVLAVVLDIFAFMTRQWGRQLSYAMSIQQNNMAMELMARDIHRASSFTTLQVGSNTVYTFTFPAAQDASGNYIPQLNNGLAAYATGTQVAYYLSDLTGSLSVSGGQSLWRATLPQGQSNWTPDTTWSLSTAASTRYNGVQSFSITTAGVPANTVQISLQLTDVEGAQSHAYSSTRTVYMVNNSGSLGS